MGYIYTAAATAYSYGGNSTEFINYMMKAINAYSGLLDDTGNVYDDNFDILFCLTNIGNEYANEGNYELARSYLQEAYELDLPAESFFDDYEEYPDYYDAYVAELRCYVVQNMAFTEIAAGDLDQAAAYLEECWEWIEKEDESTAAEDRISVRSTEAEYELACGNAEEALSIILDCKEAYESLETFSYTDFDVTIYSDLAMIYYAMGDYENALTNYKEVYELCQYRGSAQDWDSLKGLYRCYASLGDYENALYYADLYQNYLEQKSTDNTSTQEAYLSYLNEQQNSEISLLEDRFTYLFIIIAVITAFLVAGVILFILLLRKTRELKRLSNDFRKQSRTDGLTDLSNRRTLDEYMEDNWSSLNRKGSTVAVAMLDVDYFKKYNDHYGHQMGDEVLQNVAEVIKQGIRSTDFVARYGGEEFIMVLPNATKEVASSILTRIQSTLDRLNITHEFSKVSEHVTISAGCFVCSGEDGHENYEDVIRLADNALYEAKKQRNTVVIR